MKLHELGEDRLIQRLLPLLHQGRNVIAGAGDDCAVVRGNDATKLLVLKTDCIVEGVHFTSTSKPRAVGWKAMARPLSDFAAMSAVPQFSLVTLIAPATTDLRWTAELYRGLERAARAFEVSIVGGETSGTSGPISISVSVIGFVEPNRWVARSGGKIGDALYVTGRLGGSIRGKHLKFAPRLAESRWLTRNFNVHAMMDLSDGLGADLPRLARASKVGFDLEETAVPRSAGCSIQQAISDGEDYELLFALAPATAIKLRRSWQKKFPKLPLTRIGRLVRRSRVESHPPAGYVHFQ